MGHSLRDLPDPPPVTLMLHTRKLWRQWHDSPREITVTTKGIAVARTGFDVELAEAGFSKHRTSVTKDEFNDHDFWRNDGLEMEPHQRAEMRSNMEGAGAEDEGRVPHEGVSNEMIDHLVVSLKVPNTVPALRDIRHRLGPNSCIMFLQNGMGVVDHVNAEIFPDPETRPSYLVGVISHGAFTTGFMGATHAGLGSIAIGVPTRPASSNKAEIPSMDTVSPASRFLLRTLCRSPVLAAVGNSPTEIFQAQLEKLAVNAVINPITALLDARNGALNHNFAITRASRLLLAEISLVIRSMPEVKHLPNIGTRFSAERLETLVVGVSHQTRYNLSSMLADVRRGGKTEIEYINGYIIRRGEELGITCYMNYLLVQLVKGKQTMISQERQDLMPLAGQVPFTPQERSEQK